MTEIILAIVTSFLLFISAYLSYKAFKNKKRIRMMIFTPFALSALLLNIVLASFFLDNNSYKRLTKEHTIATISFETIQPQEFKAIIKPAYSTPIDVVINGDQWQLDARILKWKGVAEYMGLQPVYLLERLSGRYQSIKDEKEKNHSAINLNKNESPNFWNLLIEYQDYIPWLDAYYGNAVYLPMTDGAKFMISLGHQGLIARPRNLAAAQALQNWSIPGQHEL